MGYITLPILLSCLSLSLPTLAAEEAGHGKKTHHHVALFIGGGVETKRHGGHDEEHDKGVAAGFEYAARFHARWGAGAAVELLGQDTVRDLVFAVPISFYPVGGLRLVAGPGLEVTREDSEFLFRLGAGYEIDIAEQWTLAPEIMVDFVDGGAITVLAGLAIGYEL